MTTAVLELNDQNLLIQTEDGTLYAEPGFAQLTTTGIDTGDRAKDRAWKEPQQSYNDYWRQLNQLPLPSRQPLARHHADIAFAQLKRLYEIAGSPEDLIIAVPGSFSDQQLSLLLGLASAIPTRVKGVIDSALACCPQQQTTLLVELQLQQAVISLIEENQGIRSISQQEVIPDLGILHLYNAAARHISEQLIADYRYDPLHTSIGEQTIYDQLPNWLMQLSWADEVSFNVPTAQGELNLILRKHQIAALFEERLASLNTIIKKHPQANLCFSHGAGVIPALLPQFSEAQVCAQNAGIEQCFRLQAQLSGEQLQRVSQIQILEHTGETPTTTPHHATHLLYQNHAYPLDHPISIHIKENQLSLVSAIDNRAACVLVLEEQKLKALHQQSDLEVKVPSVCQPGKIVQIAEHSLRLIEVSNA
jgi:hypothetical protein